MSKKAFYYFSYVYLNGFGNLKSRLISCEGSVKNAFSLPIKYCSILTVPLSLISSYQIYFKYFVCRSIYRPVLFANGFKIFFAYFFFPTQTSKISAPALTNFFMTSLKS